LRILASGLVLLAGTAVLPTSSRGGEIADPGFREGLTLLHDGRFDEAEAFFVRAGGRLSALPLASVRETMRPLEVHAVRGSPSYVLGISTLHAHGKHILRERTALRWVPQRVEERPQRDPGQEDCPAPVLDGPAGDVNLTALTVARGDAVGNFRVPSSLPVRA